MKRVLEIASIIVALWLLIVTGISASKPSQKHTSTIERQLITLDKQWNDAEVRNDLTALDRIMSGEFISTSASGSVETKRDVLAEFKSGDVKLQSLDGDDYKIRVYGNTAVMNHLALLTGSYKGEDISMTYRTTHVWVKRGGRWQVVASQQTRISQP